MRVSTPGKHDETAPAAAAADAAHPLADQPPRPPFRIIMQRLFHGLRYPLLIWLVGTVLLQVVPPLLGGTGPAHAPGFGSASTRLDWCILALLFLLVMLIPAELTLGGVLAPPRGWTADSTNPRWRKEDRVAPSPPTTPDP